MKTGTPIEHARPGNEAVSSHSFTGGRLGSLGMTTLLLLLFAGCASHTPPKVDEARVNQFSGRGYLSEDRFSIATTYATWTAGKDAFDIAWTAPVEGRELPVVVYLPGIGETRVSGEAWRTAWARAGYAVLAFQPLAEDRKPWPAGNPRGDDFASLARERYGKEAATNRMKLLAALLAEVQKRRAAGDGFLGRLDPTRLAIAGYDVGAYASMLAAGEMPKGNADPVSLPLPIAAVIALSPYADFSGSSFRTRYQSIICPVLSVSGDEDADALGVVPSPSVRKAPFEYMPSSDAYLLWLANGTHAVMSGSPATAGAEPDKNAELRREEGRNSQQDAPRRNAKRGGASEGRRSGGFASAAGPLGSPTDRALAATLIEGVSTAFLDAHVRKDPVALEWLQKDARRWIGDRGELRRK